MRNFEIGMYTFICDVFVSVETAPNCCVLKSLKWVCGAVMKECVAPGWRGVCHDRTKEGFVKCEFILRGERGVLF